MEKILLIGHKTVTKTGEDSRQEWKDEFGLHCRPILIRASEENWYSENILLKTIFYTWTLNELMWD